MKVSFRLNGETRSIESAPLDRLLDVLRRDLGLTAAKEGCGEGECGACSVFLDGVLVCSCLVPMAQVRGRSVETLEALTRPGAPLHPLQRLLIETDGSQCGFCSPGMIMAGVDYMRRLARGEVEDDHEARLRAIAGNICRCTGYTKIVEAIDRAIEEAGP
ncbi:MAG: (2Fe-2S)-binding protein [Planctomycetes bacterium]|nr:(2Fe-2S)-binding protein [Planctomycetota bacterium]